LAVNYQKTPWPWFGGKADAAPAVWAALGDVDHYVEPFAGSLAVLLRRPHPCNRTYYSETVNDRDGLLCNAWRAMQSAPEAMAEAASWPVSEADLHARHLALLRWREARSLERLMGDPEWHDPVMAGWWAWGQSCWIGGGWCSGDGPWVAGDDGRIARRSGARGQGSGVREDGESGVKRRLPEITDDGRGVNRPQLREPGVGESSNHPMTMPELRHWFRFLGARLRHVRILNGDWTRAVTTGASKTLTVRQGGVCGIFLDPPYSAEAGRADSLYAVEDPSVAHDAREWCREHGDDRDYRIVLAGFDGEHDSLEHDGWRAVEWFRAGFLKGGMANLGEDRNQQHRERLWLSPHCLAATDIAQLSLFAAADG
jgi:DNA adenine methylase